MLFLLALAYNARMDAFLKDSIDIYNTYKSENTNLSDTIYKRIIDFREYVYFFNLKYFFEFPVKQDRHELFKIWELISNTYLVKQKHDEINAQVSDLTKVITLNQNEKKLEEEKEFQERIQDRDKKFNKNISLIGIVLAIAPILIDIVNLYIKESDTFKRTVVYSLIIILLILIITIFCYIPKLFNFIWKKLKSIYKKNKYQK